ncbi:MAG: helix-turn-helix domain-containing protein [Burkholderiaceae bacterium]|nr:helix-turn-helix domain-containing protein [Burkholderiaceae bacterium]
MRLLTYTKLRYGRAAALADALGYARPLISQWAHGVRSVPVMAALEIESQTQGEVMRWDLRPDDWYLIWPELINTAGAPAIPEQ